MSIKCENCGYVMENEVALAKGVFQWIKNQNSGSSIVGPNTNPTFDAISKHVGNKTELKCPNCGSVNKWIESFLI